MSGVLSVAGCGHGVAFTRETKKKETGAGWRSTNPLCADDRSDVGKISLDLRLEGGQIVIAILTTETSVELGIEPPFIVVELATPVEQVHLGHPRRLLESRLGANTDRRRFSGTIRKDRDASVHAVCGKEGAFEVQVCRRDPDGSPSLVTLDHTPSEDVRSTEQAGGILDSPEL